MDFYRERTLENIAKKGVLHFIPDFFDMNGEGKIRHIYEQKSVDYLMKVMRMSAADPRDDKVYYEAHMYNRIYDLTR